MPRLHDATLLSHLDVPGGQVWIDGTTLLFGHKIAPAGTTCVDVADLRKSRILHRIELPTGWHSHKLCAAEGMMLLKHEKAGKGHEEWGAGMGVHDVSNPAEPKWITKAPMGRKGVHRFSFDGSYASVSATDDGYVGHFG